MVVARQGRGETGREHVNGPQRNDKLVELNLPSKMGEKMASREEKAIATPRVGVAGHRNQTRKGGAIEPTSVQSTHST